MMITFSMSDNSGDCVFCTSLTTEQLVFLLRTMNSSNYGAQSWKALRSSCANSSYVPFTSFTCSDAIMHSFQVIRLISWESSHANLLKPASFSSRSRFIIANGLIVRIVVACGSSLISAVYISGFYIAAIGVDSVWTCETIAHTSNIHLDA
jgi:hypothetical protein